MNSNHDEQAGASRRDDTFTGEVWVAPAVSGVDGATVNEVLFTPGAMTHWHSHEGGQLLHITDGHGRIGTRAGERLDVSAGDTVWTPPGEEHFHAADPGHHMAHVAVSFGAIDWRDEVSEAEARDPGR